MDSYELIMLALVLWREARGESLDAKRAVAWSIRNRVRKPSWWGKDWIEVITKKFQYTSMTFAGDPNLVLWPRSIDLNWQGALSIATEVMAGQGSDPTGGATHYFDKSLDANPPSWSKVSSSVHTVDVGAFHFYIAA